MWTSESFVVDLIERRACHRYFSSSSLLTSDPNLGRFSFLSLSVSFFFSCIFCLISRCRSFTKASTLGPSVEISSHVTVLRASDGHRSCAKSPFAGFLKINALHAASVKSSRMPFQGGCVSASHGALAAFLKKFCPFLRSHF